MVHRWSEMGERVRTRIPVSQLLSFKVIDVGTNGTLVGSACYDTQQVCVYLQQFLC